MKLSRVLPALLAGLCFLGSAAQAENTRGISIVAKDPATGKAGEVQLYRKSFAVIVGIDKYPNLPPNRQLSNAVRDAQGVETVLRRNFRFDEIVTLFDEQATRSQIMRLLTTELPKRMNKEDALFIFWAGHGNQEETPYGELGYLIPYDGSADESYRNITMEEVKNFISKKLPAKHVFYVMDACYSGLMAEKRTLGKETRRDLDYLRSITREDVRQVLTAGKKGEEALDDGPKGHSVFTGRLIEVLEAAGDFITANEIQAILREKVHSDARARGHSQTPDFGPLYGLGDFVFVPNIGQKAAEIQAELVRLEQEKAELERREAEAVRSRDEAARRQAELQRQATEAKIRAEQLRREQLAAEEARLEAQRKEQERLAGEAKRQEEELANKRSEEEQRLARLKAEIEAKRKAAPIASTDRIEAAVAEIKRLSKEIESIEAAFKKEQQAGEQRIEARYAVLLAEVKAQEQAAKGKPLVQDMFETDAEFAARKKNAGSLYAERRGELEGQKQAEIETLRRKSGEESAAQTAPLRQELLALSAKEFTLDPGALAFEVGRYDIANGVFPFTLGNKAAAAGGKATPPLVKVAMNGAIRMSRDEAKEWYGHLQNGFVRPQVVARPGGEVVQVAFANDANDELLLTLEAGEFISVSEKKRRESVKRQVEEEQRQAAQRKREEEKWIYTDPQTGLQWIRNGNIAGKRMNWHQAMDWSHELSYAGHNDWRLPTKEELKSLASNNNKNHPKEWLNANGFNNVEFFYYWSSTEFGKDKAWVVGVVYNEDDTHGKHSVKCVWPVRDGDKTR